MKRRNTPTKRAVLTLLTKTGKAMSEEAIEQQIEIKINRATIYRILNQFCEDDIVHRIVAEDGKQYFAKRDRPDGTTDNSPHYHFRCLECKTIECMPVAVDFQVPQGYQFKHANCIVSGICRDCAN